MRAVLCRSLEGHRALKVEEIDPPQLGPGQVRIAVKAAGVNFADTLIVQGKYQEKPPLPFVPGMEASGTVAELAPDVRNLALGTRVVAVQRHGAFAAEIVCRADNVFPMPAGLDFVTAAAIPVVYGTAHGALSWRAALQPGETLLVTGAAGGVGLAAVEIGKAMGARVIAAARGPEKLAIAREHGAEHTIDYGTEDLRDKARALTGANGVNVVLDPVGGDVFDAALRALAWEGRIVVIGFAAGRIPQIPANYLLVKNIAAVGFAWGAHLARDPARIRKSFQEIFTWLSNGELRPHVSHVLPVEDAGAAMELLLSRRSSGKVVLSF